jgi:phospholipase C
MTVIRIIAFWAIFITLSPTIGWTEPKGLNRIKYIVVIYLENRSFDNLFGLFPGANGLENAKKAHLQVDEYDAPYQILPRVMDASQKPPVVDNRFPANLPNASFDIGRYVTLREKHPDLTHVFFTHQMQINGGRNDRFVLYSSAKALTMGYYNLSRTALWNYAKQFALADNFFQAAFGGSFLNHQWLICACTPVFPNAPQQLLPQYDEQGKLIKEPTVTQDGYAVNTIQPFYQPYDTANSANRLPPQTNPTIGDRLSEKNISWTWYSGGWDEAIVGLKTNKNFQYHHQPFVYYANYAPDSKARAEHLKDEKALFADLKANKFPQVAFFKPVGVDNQHPGYSSVIAGDKKASQVVEAIRKSKIWQSAVIIITYDEYGGFWDHVSPPVIDRWGPGSRIPAVIISPFAKKAYVDHTVYDTTSILKLIENRFNLKPLTDRDASANGLEGAFIFR